MIKYINRALMNTYLPLSLKVISLIVYILLLINGFSASSADSAFLKVLRNTNLGNLIVWSYWWPAIIIGAIFFGRVWCMVCPVEIITTFFAKIGLKQKRPKWVLSGWAITVFYMLILFVGIQLFAIHRNPAFMALYLLAIVSVSVIVGFLYEKNTFCQYFCPVGYLLGLYSRLSFFGWRVKNRDVCNICQDKSCIHKNYRYNLNEKSCGVDLYPADIQDNSTCILCAGCLKTCKNYQNESIPSRPNPGWKYIGFANDLFSLRPLKIAEMVFVMVVSGFVISEIWSEWSVTDAYLSFFPELLVLLFSIDNHTIATILGSIVLFIIIPFMVWILPFLFSKILGFSISLKSYLLQYGIAFIPIIASAHLCKALLKTTSRIPYFRYLADDITGISTAQQIIDGNIVLQDSPFWLKLLVSILITFIIFVGIWLSMKVVKKLNQNNSNIISNQALFLIPVIYGGMFLVMILAWRWF